MKIIRFRGIPIHKIYSDDDFVERIRKNLKHRKKLLLFFVPMFILLSFLLPWLFSMLSEMIDEMPEGVQKMGWIGLLLGFVFGVIFSQGIIAAMQGILMALDLFDYNRSSKLLIKYHDMLKESGLLEEDDEQQDGQIFTEEQNDIRRSWNA